MKEMAQKMKDDLILLSAIKHTTLNGKPAFIKGRLSAHPLVAEIDGPLKAEFSWPAVKRTMAKDRAFLT